MDTSVWCCWASVWLRFAFRPCLPSTLGCVTVAQTLEDGTVTLRERDSMQQVRLAKGEVGAVVRELVDEAATWADVCAKYPVVAQKEADAGQ